MFSRTNRPWVSNFQLHKRNGLNGHAVPWRQQQAKGRPEMQGFDQDNVGQTSTYQSPRRPVFWDIETQAIMAIPENVTLFFYVVAWYVGNTFYNIVRPLALLNAQHPLSRPLIPTTDFVSFFRVFAPLGFDSTTRRHSTRSTHIGPWPLLSSL